MHASVDLDNRVRALAQEAGEEPVHETVAPVRRACKRHTLRASTPANLAQRGADKLLWVRHEGRCLADLGHGRGHEVRLDTLHVDAVRFQLGCEGRGPLLEECLAARVGCEERGGEEATERSHGQDQTTLARDHTGGNELCHA